MKSIRILLGICLLLTISLAAYVFFGPRTPRIVYVDNIALFNGFLFKKERQAEYDRQKSLFQGKLDTLHLNYLSLERAFRQNPSDRELEKRAAYGLEYFETSDRMYAAKLDSMDTRFNEEVWGKINAYLGEYGKQKGYDLIIGASGTGTLMYGNEAYDKTEDALEYINGKYEGQ